MTPKTTAGSDSRRPFNFLFVVSFILLSAAGLYCMRINTALERVPVNFDQIVETGRFENGTPLKRTYTGIEKLDFVLSFLVTAFLAGPAGWDDGVRLQQIHFLVSFFSVVCIFNVEACRTRNRRRAISYPAVWAFFYQTVGAAAIIPLFYVAYTLSSKKDSYLSSGREVPLGYARALLPATVIGYLVPTLVIYYPWGDINITQNLTALWQPAPMFPGILLLVLAPLLSPSSPSSVEAAKKTTTMTLDRKYLRQIYLVAGIISAITHLVTLYICLTSSNPQLSLSYVFLPSKATWKDSTVMGLHYTFQWDSWFVFVSSIAWTWLVVMDTLRSLKAAGPTLYDMVLTAFNLSWISFLGGPGTAMAMTWQWRENKMAMIEEGEKKSTKSKAT